MRHELSIDGDLFTSIVELLWKKSSDAVKELVENSFDCDSKKVLVTFASDGSAAVEDDAGMDAKRLSKFMKVGGLHQQGEDLTPNGRRVVGKYRVGRLAALGVFDRMQVRTRLERYADSLVISYDDLRQLASGRAKLEGADLPPLGRNGTEILLTGPKRALDFEGVRQMLAQLPILRTPGFEVYMKKADRFREWDFEGAKRLLAKEIPGVKILVDLSGGVKGVVTIADDRALPLDSEDRGIGIVVSSHLVNRTYFGFENSPHRFDRITGWIENNALRTTFGAKDQVIEDLVYAAFVENVRLFIEKEVVPKLAQIEVHRLGKMEMKLLRKVDRKLGNALAELPLELFRPGGERIPPEALRTVLPQDKVLEQTAESSMVVIEEPEGATQPAVEPVTGPSPAPPASEPPDTPQVQTDTAVGWVQPQREESSLVPLSEVPKTSLPEAPQTEEVGPPPSPPKAPRPHVGHYLHDLGVVVVPYDDKEDGRPSYGVKEHLLAGFKVRAIFVNRKHPSYVKCEKEGTLVDHLLRLITNELVGMSYEGSEAAMGVANRLYGIAVAKG